jgi:hypothetical protein
MFVFALTGLLVFGWVVLVVESVSGRVHAFVDLVGGFVDLVEIEVQLQLLLAEILRSQSLNGLDPGQSGLLLVFEGRDLRQSTLQSEIRFNGKHLDDILIVQEGMSEHLLGGHALLRVEDQYILDEVLGLLGSVGCLDRGEGTGKVYSQVLIFL